MLEWITGDPLVGILITIGFFTFLILGRALKLKKMKRNSSS
jgi:hypothetical protein